MNLIISNRSSEPIYEQLKKQIKAAIIAGEISPDEQLPSIRELARNLKVSVITTTRAYSDLEAEGYIVNRQGKGAFVLPLSRGVLHENALAKIGEYISSAILEAKNNKIPYSEFIDTMNILMAEEDYNEHN
jgi:GntR family transcriptional regulator